MLLGAAWIVRSAVASYVCIGASVLVFTREMLVISDLVAGHQCAARTAAGLPPFSTVLQMVSATIAARLPVHLSSRSNGRGGCGVNSYQRFLRVYIFDCVWRLDSTVVGVRVPRRRLSTGRKRQSGDWYRQHRGTQPNSGRQPQPFLSRCRSFCFS